MDCFEASSSRFHSQPIQPSHLVCLASLGLILRIHSTCSISRGILENNIKLTKTLIITLTYNGELFP